MPRAFKPRPGPSPRGAGRRTPSISGEIAEEIRRTARPPQGDEALTRLERAVGLLRRGDHRQAAREAEAAKSLAPRSAAVREVLGLAHYGQERWRDALREMQAYRRMSGRLDQNHIIADCYRALGNPERAVAEAEAGLGARIPEGSRAEAAIVGASALADLGRFREALALLRRIPTRQDVGRPHDLRVWYVRGDILARAGRRDEAAREFRRIIRHDHSAFDAAERLAELGSA